MPVTPDWLQRLAEATDYRDLRGSFSELQLQARSSPDGSALAKSIDQAIFRIEQERARDQRELDSFEQQYAAFKNQQSGVTGWLKRHLPFSETRRQDQMHQRTMADQVAEVCADNLFIARCQMLKQSLLPKDQRQLGLTVEQWRKRLDGCESIPQLREYGNGMVELALALQSAQAFTSEIRQDIDAFAKACFSDPGKQQGQKADLAAARHELSAIDSEIEAHQNLLTKVVERAKQLVDEELSMHDAAYYTLLKRIEHWKDCLQIIKPPIDLAGNLAELTSKRSTWCDALQQNAHRQQDLRSRAEDLRRELASARQRLIQAEQHRSEVALHHDEAKRRSDGATAAFESAKALFDRHCAKAEGDLLSSGGAVDPVHHEFQRLKRDRDAAQVAVQIAAVPYEAAASHYAAAAQTVTKLESEMVTVERKLETLARETEDLEENLATSSESLTAGIGELEPLLNAYFLGVETLDWKSQVVELSRSVHWEGALHTMRTGPAAQLRQAPFTAADSINLKTFFDDVAEALRQDKTSLKQRLAEDERRRLNAWQQRCSELLEKNAATLVCQ